MTIRRQHGSEQPGIKILGATLRIPFIHMRISWPEFIQGNFVSAATALALVPLLTGYFGLSFEEAVAMTFIQSVIMSSSWFMFGEPYAPGWLTPVLPFVLVLVLSDSFPTPVERLQMMTAISLSFSLLLAIFGVTGLGAKLVRLMPEVLKGTVILGAAIAAFIKVFDMSVTNNILNSHPISASVAIGLSLLLAFSAPLQRLAKDNKLIAGIIALGLLPGFVMGGLAGYLSGELSFDIQSGILTLPFGSLMTKVMPYFISVGHQ